MGTRTSFVSALELAALGLVCSLLLIDARADSQPATTTQSRLESLLTAHDVRQAIHAPQTKAERGR
jgi:hypothetical protein